MTTTRITVEQARIDFPTDADKDAEYTRLDRLETFFAGRESEMDEIDYRRGIIQSTDARSFMSGNQAL